MLKGNVATKVIGTSVGLFLPPRANRPALILFPSSTVGGDYTIGNDPSLEAGRGIYVPTTGSPVYLTKELVGDLFGQPLFAIAGAVATVIPYVETLDVQQV